MSAEILLFNRLKNHTGAWMARPGDWVWTAPGGQPQGFGLNWRDNVGRANLLWLAMDMDTPPSRQYNLRFHQLCMLILTHGEKMGLAGLPLFDQAGTLTLAQFRNVCQEHNESIYPLLVLLANRRMEHAHT